MRVLIVGIWNFSHYTKHYSEKKNGYRKLLRKLKYLKLTTNYWYFSKKFGHAVKYNNTNYLLLIIIDSFMNEFYECNTNYLTK